MNQPKISLVGRVYTKLTVLSYAGKKGAHNTWNCACECGGTKVVRTGDLKHKQTRSCGCLYKEAGDRRRIHPPRIPQPERFHGKTRTVEYRSWAGMKARCYNPKDGGYHNYGSRGVEMCPEWRGSFLAFLAAMGLRPSNATSIDRIDPDGNYEPGNCRWADAATQAANQRRSINSLSGYPGVSWDKTRSKWRAKIKIRGKTKHLLLTDDLPAAIEARQKAEVAQYGRVLRHKA